MIECDPAASADVLYVVFPPLSVPVPRVVVPSLNVTVPVAAEGVTVAVRVTEFPYVDGFDEDATVTEEDDFPNAIPTTDIQQRAKHRKRNAVRTVMDSFAMAFMADGIENHPIWDCGSRIEERLL